MIKLFSPLVFTLLVIILGDIFGGHYFDVAAALFGTFAIVFCGWHYYRNEKGRSFDRPNSR